MYSHMMTYSGGLSGLIAFAISLIVLIFLIKMLVGLVILGRQRSGNSPEMKLKKNLKHYRESGLTDNDIRLFRETLAEAKAHITSWEAATKRLTDLSVIEDVTGGLEASKKIFQYIVQNPNDLTRQSDFLYKQLPNMTKLIESLEKQQQEAMQSERDQSETLLLIKTLSSQLAENYHQIVMTDVKIIGKEVENG